MAETELITVEFVEREIIKVEFTTIDILPGGIGSGTLPIIETPIQLTNKRFQTSYPVFSGTLKVFFNGLKEKEITILTSTLFEFKIDILSSDTIEVEYVRQS